MPLRELWHFRELLYFLVWRDLKVRYKQSFLGVLWIVLQPLVTMVVFTMVFNRVLGVGGEGDVPYPIFVYSALLPWTYFSSSLSRASTSLVSNAKLVSKVYFPRLIIPLSAVLPGLVDFAIAFVVLLGMMLMYDYPLNIMILTLPLALLLSVMTSLGVGFWLSALDVRYRDVQYLAPFLVQIWMYASPIIYPISKIPERWQFWYNLNPMTGVITSFRYAILGTGGSWFMPWPSILVSLFLLGTGLVYFRRVEREFADII